MKMQQRNARRLKNKTQEILGILKDEGYYNQSDFKEICTFIDSKYKKGGDEIW
jgi:hypothetical protein